MKERPILFSGLMVRALLDGSKTQTRRLVKPVGRDDSFVLQDYGDGWWPYRSDDGESALRNDGNETPHQCPYGFVGDRLWVRETWAPLTTGYAYRADPIWNAPPADRWHPSIHMPRAASRITLEITGVRVERLQDISGADAVAEGITLHPDHHHRPATSLYGPIQTYRDLWNDINGADAWDANPWVWAVSFRRVPLASGIPQKPPVGSEPAITEAA